MNKVILMGRLTRDAEIRWTQGQDQKCIARFTMAVDRRVGRDAQGQKADFPSCVAFGKVAEFLEKYGKKGVKFIAEGRIQTGSYEKDGQTIYTTDVIVESVEFAESKSSGNGQQPQTDADGFMNIPEGMDEQMPFA